MNNINIAFFKDHIENNIVKIANPQLNELVKNYFFIHISESFVFHHHEIIYQNIKESKFAIIKKCKNTSENSDDQFFIIGFKQTIIIINQSLLFMLQDFFSTNKNLTIYFLSNVKEIFNQKIQIPNKQIENDLVLKEEIW